MMLCLKAAIDGLKAQGLPVDDNLLEHLAPLGWVQINLTSHYVWRQDRRVERRVSEGLCVGHKLR